MIESRAARFYDLGINSFWYDELISVTSADPGRSLGSIILNVPANEIQPPLYVVLLALWRRVVGDSEIAIRTLSAVLRATTVVVADFGSRRLLDDSITLFFSLLMACSFGAIARTFSCSHCS